MITSSYISFLIAVVNLIAFKNQVVSKNTNFQKQHNRMLVTIFQSIFILKPPYIIVIQHMAQNCLSCFFLKVSLRRLIVSMPLTDCYLFESTFTIMHYMVA